MTNKEKLLHFSAQLDQLSRELEAVGKDQSISLSASHEAGVVQFYLSSASKKLIVLSGKV